MKKGQGKYSKPKRARESRAKFPRISGEMKEWSALAASELITWPSVTTKPMFGFLSFYREGKIFAALPQTRGFSSSSSLILKFDPMPPGLFKRAHRDPRMDTNTRVPGKGWFSFELNSSADLGDALWWLNQSYENAKDTNGA